MKVIAEHSHSGMKIEIYWRLPADHGLRLIYGYRVIDRGTAKHGGFDSEIEGSGFKNSALALAAAKAAIDCWQLIDVPARGRYRLISSPLRQKYGTE